MEKITSLARESNPSSWVIPSHLTDWTTTVLLLLLSVLLLFLLCLFFFYTGKFACKILIQGFSYAFPVNLTIPVAISLLIAACGLRNGDPCFFHNVIPDYMFFESPPVHFFNDFITKQVSLEVNFTLHLYFWNGFWKFVLKCHAFKSLSQRFQSCSDTNLCLDSNDNTINIESND